MTGLSTGDCTSSTCPVGDGFLREPPSLAGAAVMLAVFAILVPINLWVGARCRTTTYTLTLVVGLLVEVMGYVGQLLLRSNLASKTYFLLFLLGTITGPVFITSAIYSTLPHIVAVYGGDVGIGPRPVWLSYAFVSNDGFTLFFQILGCAFTVEGFSRLEIQLGVNVLLVGLALQIASIIIFLGAYLVFLRRVAHNRDFLDPRFADIYLSTKFKTALLCIQVALALILVRTIARLVQISSGVASNLSQSRIYVVVLDGALVLLAAIALTAVPPGPAFGRAWGATSPSRRKARRHLATLDLAARASLRSPSYRLHEHESPYPSPQGQPGSAGIPGTTSSFANGYGSVYGGSARGSKRFSSGWMGHKRQASTASSGNEQQQQVPAYERPAYERPANDYTQVPYVPAPQAAVSLSQQYGQGRVVESQVVAPGTEGSRTGGSGSGPGSGGRTRTRSSPRVYEEDMVRHDALW